MPFLAALGALLSRLMFSKAGPILLQAITFLGIGLATATFAVAPLRAYIEQGFGGLPATVSQWVGFLQIDIYATAVLSAYAASAVKRVLLRKLGA